MEDEIQLFEYIKMKIYFEWYLFDSKTPLVWNIWGSKLCTKTGW